MANCIRGVGVVGVCSSPDRAASGGLSVVFTAENVAIWTVCQVVRAAGEAYCPAHTAVASPFRQSQANYPASTVPSSLATTAGGIVRSLPRGWHVVECALSPRSIVGNRE